MFVSIEGLNGVGKTEVVKNVRDKLGYLLVPVSPSFRSAMEAMEREEDLNARYLLFLSAMIHSSNRIKVAQQCGKAVVVDGYVARTHAYHVGMGSSLRVNIDQWLLKPTVSILLTCEEKVRQQRIARRSRPRDLWDDLADRSVDSINAYYRRCGFPIVDTTHLSIDETFRKVRSILDLHGRVAH
jgi:thymidylate kinase